jgi:hypothetical protein
MERGVVPAGRNAHFISGNFADIEQLLFRNFLIAWQTVPADLSGGTDVQILNICPG